MTTVQLRIVSNATNPDKHPPGCRFLFVLDSRGESVLGLRLVPDHGVIFAEDITMWRYPLRVRLVALQLALQAVTVTSAVMGMPVVAIPRSRSLRKLLMRNGWEPREDPAVLVRMPGVTFSRPLPTGRRTKPPTMQAAKRNKKR